MALNKLRKNASRMAQMPGKLRDLLAQDDEWTKSKLIGMLADHGGNLAALKTFFEQKVEKTDYTETLTNHRDRAAAEVRRSRQGCDCAEAGRRNVGPGPQLEGREDLLPGQEREATCLMCGEVRLCLKHVNTLQWNCYEESWGKDFRKCLGGTYV